MIKKLSFCFLLINILSLSFISVSAATSDNFISLVDKTYTGDGYTVKASGNSITVLSDSSVSNAIVYLDLDTVNLNGTYDFAVYDVESDSSSSYLSLVKSNNVNVSGTLLSFSNSDKSITFDVDDFQLSRLKFVFNGSKSFKLKLVLIESDSEQESTAPSEQSTTEHITTAPPSEQPTTSDTQDKMDQLIADTQLTNTILLYALGISVSAFVIILLYRFFRLFW